MTRQVLKKGGIVEPRQSHRGTLSTRARIIEAAGQVFAEKGCERARGTEICERAGVNAASISYHFGGLDLLYREVLREAYDAMVNFEEFNQAMDAESDLEKRLQILCRLMIKYASQPIGETWQMRVISREALSPSTEIEHLRKTRLVPKMQLIRDLVADLLGVPPQHPAAVLGCLQVMAPMVMLQVGDWTSIVRMFPGLRTDSVSEELFGQHLFVFSLGGLRAVAALHGSSEDKKSSSGKRK